MTTIKELCTVCGLDREWHQGHRPRHLFSDAASITHDASSQRSGKRTDAPNGAPRVIVARDPVLRALLISKGIIGVNELDGLEKVLLGVAQNGGGAVDLETLRSAGSGDTSDSGDRSHGATEGGVRPGDPRPDAA